MEGAERTTQGTDVRVVDVAVHVVVRDPSMHTAPYEIRKPTDTVNIASLVEDRALLEGEPASLNHFLTDRLECRVEEADRGDRVGDVVDHREAL